MIYGRICNGLVFVFRELRFFGLGRIFHGERQGRGMGWGGGGEGVRGAESTSDGYDVNCPVINYAILWFSFFKDFEFWTWSNFPLRQQEKKKMTDRQTDRS